MCLFHKWGKWEDKSYVTYSKDYRDKNGELIKFDLKKQISRKCNKCNKKEIREID